MSKLDAKVIEKTAARVTMYHYEQYEAKKMLLEQLHKANSKGKYRMLFNCVAQNIFSPHSTVWDL